MTPLPDAEFWTLLLTLLGGIKGMGIQAVVVAVVQLVMVFFKTSLSDFAGKWKLTIVTGLTFAGTFLAAYFQSMDLIGALLSGAVLAALQVFVSQVIKQFTEKTA